MKNQINLAQNKLNVYIGKDTEKLYGGLSKSDSVHNAVLPYMELSAVGLTEIKQDVVMVEGIDIDDKYVSESLKDLVAYANVANKAIVVGLDVDVKDNVDKISALVKGLRDDASLIFSGSDRETFEKHFSDLYDVVEDDNEVYINI